MNYVDNYPFYPSSCDRGSGCGGGSCKPAEYDCGMFDLQVDPYDPTKLKVVIHGMTYTVDLPKIAETDTSLSTNFSNATLIYKAEAHTDELSGSQLGSLVNVKDLRDTDIDEELEGNCYELIFHKFNDCGAGCRSAADRWMNFNINSDGAKQTSIPYVRGANLYGCPEYLDFPSNPAQYWFGAWSPVANGFTYLQPQLVPRLPRDENNDPIVSATDPTTGLPIKGPVPLNCLAKNLVLSLGVSVYGTFRIIQATPQFTSTFDPYNGYFTISWNDWNFIGTPQQIHCGGGTIYGKLDWTTSFDSKTGNITYTVTHMRYYNIKYETDKGTAATQPLHITVKAVLEPSHQEIILVNQYEFTSNTDWTYNINKSFDTNFSVTLGPGQKAGPFDIAYMYNAWYNQDDEGYAQVNFQNKLYDWENC